MARKGHRLCSACIFVVHRCITLFVVSVTCPAKEDSLQYVAAYLLQLVGEGGVADAGGHAIVPTNNFLSLEEVTIKLQHRSRADALAPALLVYCESVLCHLDVVVAVGDARQLAHAVAEVLVACLVLGLHLPE